MKRWLSNLAAVLSLLLSLAASGAWAMSYAHPIGWRLIGIAPVSTRAQIVTMPYWFIVLLGLPMPLLWVQGTRRRRDTPVR